MNPTTDWNSWLELAVTTVFNDGLRLTLRPDSDSSTNAAIPYRASIPLQLGQQRLRLVLSMGTDATIDVHRRLGGGAVTGADVGQLQETVAESANLVAGRLAGLVPTSLGILEIGTPDTARDCVASAKSHRAQWSSDAGCLSAQIEVIQ